MSLPSLVQIDVRIFEKAPAVLEHPLQTDKKSVVNRQQLSRGWTDLAQIWNIDRPHDAPSTVHVQGQGVKGQGHNVT